MREISSQEINIVAGGIGFGAKAGNIIGTTIGGLIDNTYGQLTGITTSAEATAGGLLGSGFGSLIDALASNSTTTINDNVNKAITDISQGLTGAIKGVSDGIKNIKGLIQQP